MAKSKGKSRSTQVRSKLAIQVGERIRKTRKQEGLSIETLHFVATFTHPMLVI